MTSTSAHERLTPRVLALAAVYIVAGKGGLMLDAVAGFAALVWPASGIALAALVLLGVRLWPAIAIGALVVNLWAGASIGAALGIAAGNTLEAVVGATALLRMQRFSPALDRRKDVVALIVRAGLASTLISATVGVLALYIDGAVAPGHAVEAWRSWWLGDLIGDLVVAPVLLTWSGGKASCVNDGQARELLLLNMVVIVLGVLVFHAAAPTGAGDFGRMYLFFPPLMWAALRLGTVGAATTTLMVATVAVTGTALGRGPFLLDTLNANLFALQIFMAIAATASLLLAALSAERETVTATLKAARDELETKVEARDKDLRTAYEDLERRVQERTSELSALNESLSRSEARKAAILESALDSIITMDEQGLIVDFNPAAEATFGRVREHVVGKGMATLLVPERFRQQHREGLARYLTTGEARALGKRMELTALRSDGTELPVEVAIRAVHSPGHPTLFIGYLRDLTDRLRAEKERSLLEQRIQEGQKLESLGVLAGGIAHDFNNILMAVLGNASLTRRSLENNPIALAHLTQIEEASRRATDLCRQMLAYAGKGRFVLQLTNLNQLIEETTHLLQVSISKKAVLRFHLDARLPSMVADATQIRQVLMNLVINASDAIGERSGVISISTGVVRADRTYLQKTFLAPEIPEGDYVFLEVSDTGVGMSAETQARIFEPFFSSKFAGRGLGLSAVLGIVRGHKGAVKVYSELGKGSSFKFLLPVAPADADALPKPRARTARALPPGTILVVDDEETVRAVASRMLEDLGFRAVTACDGRDAQTVYREHRSEIIGVLMDLTMPHLDGEEAFRELRRAEPSIRVLLMSGYNEQDAIARFVGKGLAGFIQKPFNVDELHDALHKVLG